MRSFRRAVFAAMLATAGTAGAQICTPFTDVPAADPFCTNIQWMYNRAITLGCTATTYCPTAFVRRDQMAAFMNRLGNVVFQQGGNAFGATAVLGATDAQTLELRSEGQVVARYSHPADGPNVIGGSSRNQVATGVFGATIAGGGALGGLNAVSDHLGTVSGGNLNNAGDGTGTPDDACCATVGGGSDNRASSQYATIAGGQSNRAGGTAAAVGGGQNNHALGNYAVVPGGANNIASGNGSFAAGANTRGIGDGCFVWGDVSTNNVVSCFGLNSFVARASGGFFFFTAGTTQATYTGAYLPAGGSAWQVFSDRRHKEAIVAVDPQTVLDRLLAIPIATWHWRSQSPSIRHMGPMAQDFHAAFGLGESETGIATVDADGVALAAIQGLNAKLEAKLAARDAEVAALRDEIAALRALVMQGATRAAGMRF